MTTEIAPATPDVPRETREPIEAARAEVRRLLEVELEWSAKRDAGAVGLAEIEASAGEAVLDGATVGDAAGDVAAARAEIDTIDRTVAAARARRHDAIRAVFAAEADELRGQATAKREEAATREGKTAWLLLALEGHEGVAYAPVQPDRPTRLDGLQGGALSIVTIPIPITEGLIREATNLEQQARQVEARPATRHGAATGTLEEVLATAMSEPMVIGPTSTAIRPWAAAIEATVRAEHERLLTLVNGDARAREQGLGKPMHFAISWAAGELDPRSSRGWAGEVEPASSTYARLGWAADLPGERTSTGVWIAAEGQS